MFEQVALYTTDLAAARNEIDGLGGRITHQFSDHAFVAALPDGVTPDDLDHATTAKPQDLDEVTGLLVEAWERRPATETEVSAPGPGEGKRWDAPGFQPPAHDDDPDDGPDGGVDGAPTAEGALPHSTGTPTSRYMTGSIAVGVVVVSGPTTELTFSPEEHLQVLSEVEEGLNFLANLEPRAKISFVYDVHLQTVDVAPGPTTTYESAEAPFRDAALAQMGFPASRSGSRQYVQDLRAKKGTDWAYVVYFTKYPLHHFAYASGERTTMHFDNDGWGSEAINRVFAHESCHIFGAADEYGSCSCGGSHGELGVPNDNCRNCAGDQEPCLMNGNTLQMCEWSRRQIGWDESLFPGIPTRLDGRYTLVQESTGRYLDAHESTAKDFSVVTRTVQGNDTQRWVLTQVGQLCTLQQASSDRYLDAHESTARDFSVVTRTAQNNDTQRWVLVPAPDQLATYTIQQLSSGRHLDAHTSSPNDFSMVTRPAQGNDSQRWQLDRVGPDTYTLRQRLTGRYADAHDSGDFSAVTRPEQANDTQHWTIRPIGGVYTLQQVSSNRNLDAHESSDEDYSVVTRVSQNNDSQRWILTPLGNGTYTVQQLSSGRYLDAHPHSSRDYSVVTRRRQDNDTQRWIVTPA